MREKESVMSRRHWVLGGLLAAAGMLFVLAPSGDAVSQRIAEVFVTNFPDLFRVEGVVRVDGPVRLSTEESFREIIVPPVRRAETTRLVEAGTLSTQGFAQLVLSLQGQVKGEVNRPGGVGAILIPDEQSILDAFNDRGLFQFGLEVEAGGVAADTPYFASSQPRYYVGFPSYRILLYNTTDKTVTVNLYAYLTN